MRLFKDEKAAKKACDKKHVYLTEEECELVGYPVNLNEEPIAVIHVSDKTIYLYNRADVIRFFFPHQKGNTLYYKEDLVYLYSENQIKNLKPSGFIISSWRKIIPVYLFNDLFPLKNKRFFKKEEVVYPYFNKFEIGMLPATFVGYVKYNHTEVTKVYKVEKEKIVNYTHQPKDRFLVEDSWFNPIRNQLNRKMNLKKFIVGFEIKKRILVPLFDPYDVLKSKGLIFAKKDEIGPKLSLYFIPNKHYPLPYRFPTTWELTDEHFSLSGFSDTFKPYFGLNQKGKELLPIIEDSQLLRYITSSIVDLSRIRDIMIRSNYHLGSLKLIGRTEDGKLVFDINHLKNKQKVRIRLLTQ